MRLKRMAMAMMVALLLAVGLTRTLSIFSSPCAILTPSEWFLWWLYDCEKASGGGGGSGAGQP